jgi:dTDP-glucose 4,6-dehydratase
LKLLVTGGLGFIGSNFILKMLKENNDLEIINIDDKLYGSNIKSLEKIEKSDKYEFVRGNITNKEILEKIIPKCDAVINFAAESFVDRSISNATSSFDSNLKGIFILLELVKKYKKRLIQVSTDEVFGSLNKGSANEISRFNPSSPYSATKAGAELLIKSYFVTYDCNCIITRCTNNYGPRQFPEKLIPKIILLAEQGKKIPIYGTGTNIRDWIFVEDHCDAVFNVLNNGKAGESYNISADNEIDNISIVKKILSLMNKSEELIEFVEDRPGHDFRYSMDSSKIRTELGWENKVKFYNGLKNTVDWYLSNKDWWKNIVKDSLNQTPWKNQS